MPWSITLGRIAGTAVRIHVTFLILLAFIGLNHYRVGGAAAAIDGVLFITLIFGCVLLHEFGHILAARRYGVRTPDVTLWPFGGVASLERMPDKPSQELVVALAGPAVNVVIAAVLILILGATVDPQDLARLEDPSANLLARLASVNIVLVVFNMIPAFPMDGGRVLRALLAMKMGMARATALAASIGQALAFVFAFLGLFVNPMLIVIAVFVFMAASAEAQGEQIKALARGLRAQDAMVRSFESLPVSASVGEAVDALIGTSQREFPVLDASGRMVGLVTREDMIRALRTGGPEANVSESMRRDVPEAAAWSRLDEAFQKMQTTGAPAVAVTDAQGRLIGLVTPENIGEMLMVEAARPGFRFRR
jgi:Zn-dependent protease/CBS domain-containing protein